jgi:signal transduction histidine kinase
VDGLPPVQGDRVQLQQVVLNLIVNAVEAMGGSGDDARDLLITTEPDEANGVRVAVRDSGPGLSQESLTRLFDAFYTTKTDGMGMGLSICRSIVEAHGGRVWTTANQPHGTSSSSHCHTRSRQRRRTTPSACPTSRLPRGSSRRRARSTCHSP